MNFFVKAFLCLFVCLSAFLVKSQEKVKTTTFTYNVLNPSFKVVNILKCVISKDFALMNMTPIPYINEKDNDVLEQGLLPDTNKTKMSLSLTRYPTVSLINRATGEIWAMWEQENGKVAVKQKGLKPEYVSGTNSNYILDYLDEYKTIGKYKCQNVKITNKTTNEISFSYVTKIPEGTFYSMPYETGIKDVIVQSYGLKNALSLSLISITNELASIDLFQFSKDTNVFNTPEEYGKWGKKYFENKQKQENN